MTQRKSPQDNNDRGSKMGIGIAIGIAIGAGIGVAMENIAIGVAMDQQQKRVK